MYTSNKFNKNLVQCLYTEIYKTSLKLKKISKQIKVIRCTWFRCLNTKMLIVPKLMYRSNIILIKIPAVFSLIFFSFSQNGKLNLKFIWKCKGPRIVKYF